jgi:predicted nucleotidyltransferase
VIREDARGCGPRVVAVWLYGSVARGEDRSRSDLDVAIVADADALPSALEAVRDALHLAGRKLRFEPSVVGLEPSDVARLARERDPWWIAVARDAIVLLGPRPDALARPPRPVAGRARGGRRHNQEGADQE